MRVVVGAVVRDGAGRMLAARRRCPPGWELPGGKVEPGETEPAALARELREELGIEIAVGTRIGPAVPITDHLVLHAWTATCTTGTPTPLEHAELRWVPPAELDLLDWLPADRPIVTAVRIGE